MPSDLRTTKIKLSNGVLMPQLGLGMWQSPVGNVAMKAVVSALQLGYRHLDTAAIYENEESVGAGMRASGVPREEIFVTTKLWNSDQGYESTLKAFDVSLKKLGLTYIDLYLIHWPKGVKQIETDGKLYLDTWRAFEKLYEEKKVRAIGVSNFEPNHIDDILNVCKVAPMVNQVELHPLNSQPKLRAYCASKSIAVAAWSPLGHGHLIDDPTIQKVAEKHKKTGAQVLLRWDIQHGIITIPKSIDADRIKENSEVFDFVLSPEDMALIDGMNEDDRYGPHPNETRF